MPRETASTRSRRGGLAHGSRAALLRGVLSLGVATVPLTVSSTALAQRRPPRPVRPTRPAVPVTPAAPVDPAQAAAAAEQQDRERARLHFERGVEFAAEQRWADAIRELTAARDIRATASVHFNLGMAFRAVGQSRNAIASFRAFLRTAGERADADRVRQVESYVRELEGTLGRVRVRAEPANASIEIDGGPAERELDGSYVLDAGRHVLVLAAEGYRPVTRVVTLSPGGSSELEVRLPSTQNSARLVIESNVESSEIYVDGRVTGNGRVDEYVTAGSHTVRVTARGMSTFTRDVLLLPGASSTVRVALADQRSIVTRPAFWVVTGVVVAGLAVGGVFLFSSQEPRFEGALGHVQDALSAPALR